MPTKALLLDGFGTVLDWRAPFAQANEDALRRALASVDDGRVGLPPFAEWLPRWQALRAEDRARLDPEHRERDYGARWRESLTRSGLPKRHARDLGTAACARYFQELGGSIRLAPDAGPEFWLALPEGVRVALVTNYGDGPSMRKALDRLRVAFRFDALVITGEVGRLKPHPAVFERALDALGVGPSEAVMVGDDVARDVRGAHAAGIPAVLVANPREGLRDARPAPASEDAGPAIARIASLADLPPLLASR